MRIRNYVIRLAHFVPRAPIKSDKVGPEKYPGGFADGDDVLTLARFLEI